MESRWTKWAGNLLLVLLSLLFTAALIEAAANYWLWQIAPENSFKFYASTRQLQVRYGADFDLTKANYTPHRYLGFYPTPNLEIGENRHNALGFRGDEIVVPKPDNIYRILTLGGSTTYGTSVLNYQDAYPYQLQQYLREQGYENVEVVNGGSGSYASYESLINLQFRGLPLQPDLVLIYHAFNDAHARLVYPAAAYQGDNSGAIIPALQNTRMPAIWEYSTALRILGIELDWTIPHNALEWRLVTYPVTSHVQEFVKQKRQGTYPYGVFEQASAMAMFEMNPPTHFRRNMTNMAVIAQAHGAQVMFMTFAYSTDFPDEPQVNSEEYIFALNQHNDVTREVAAATDALLYDFAEAMPDDPTYYTDGRHFNEGGNALRGQLIGDALIASGVLD